MRKVERPTGAQRDVLRAEREQAAAEARTLELAETRSLRDREARLRSDGADEAERRALVRTLLHDEASRAALDLELTPPLEELARDENELTLALVQSDTLDTAAERECNRVYAWVSSAENASASPWPPGFEVARRLLDAYDEAAACRVRDLPIPWVSAERVYAHARSFPALAPIPLPALASIARRVAILLFNKHWLLPYREGALDSSPLVRGHLQPAPPPAQAPVAEAPAVVALAAPAPAAAPPAPAEAALAAGELVMCLDCGSEKPPTGPCPGCDPQGASPPPAPATPPPLPPAPAAPPAQGKARGREKGPTSSTGPVEFARGTLVLDYTGKVRVPETMHPVVDKQAEKTTRQVIAHVRIKEALVFLRGEAGEPSIERRRTGQGRVVKATLEAGEVVEVMSPSRYDSADLDRHAAAGVQLVTIRWRGVVRLVRASMTEPAVAYEYRGDAP